MPKSSLRPSQIKSKAVSATTSLIVPTEHQECVALIQYFAYKPEIGKFLIKIPNEGKRSWGYAKKMRAEGLKAGVPDYFLAIPTPEYAGMWIEMKRKNGTYKLHGEQADWITRLLQNNYYATFAFGADDAIQKIHRYLKGT